MDIALHLLCTDIVGGVAKGAKHRPPLPPTPAPQGAALVQALVLENGQSIRAQDCPPQPGFRTMPVHSRPTVNAQELNRAEFPVTTQKVISIPDPGSPVPRAWQQWPRLHMTHRGGAHSGWGQHPCQQLWRQHLGTIQVALGTIIQWGRGGGRGRDAHGQKAEKVDQRLPLAKT